MSQMVKILRGHGSALCRDAAAVIEQQETRINDLLTANNQLVSERRDRDARIAELKGTVAALAQRTAPFHVEPGDPCYACPDHGIAWVEVTVQGVRLCCFMGCHWSAQPTRLGAVEIPHGERSPDQTAIRST